MENNLRRLRHAQRFRIDVEIFNYLKQTERYLKKIPLKI